MFFLTQLPQSGTDVIPQITTNREAADAKVGEIQLQLQQFSLKNSLNHTKSHDENSLRKRLDDEKGSEDSGSQVEDLALKPTDPLKSLI